MLTCLEGMLYRHARSAVVGINRVLNSRFVDRLGSNEPWFDSILEHSECQFFLFWMYVADHWKK